MSSIVLQAVPEWRLDPADEAMVADLLERCFRPEGITFGGRSYFKQRHHLRLLAREGHHILGHVGVTWRAVRLGEALIDVAGLADVATDPSRRGEGIATGLVAAALAEARGSLAGHVLLFGEAGLYGGLGFRLARNELRHVEMDAGRTLRVALLRDEALMVLPLRDQPWDENAPLDLLGPMF